MKADDANDVFNRAIEERGGNVKGPSQVSCYPGRQTGSRHCLLSVF